MGLSGFYFSFGFFVEKKTERDLLTELMFKSYSSQVIFFLPTKNKHVCR